ncbi:MAG: 30S ribosome-binding factor RbfA [Anaerolineales bacterium]|nr:MAG: 30S ribosome-binding factor RbfA [Anaerolineales bacterium]
MTTRRQRQVAELLHQEISLLIQRRARDPRVRLVTVTGVEMSPDLRLAHVYVSVMGDQEAAKQALMGLRHAAGFFRRELGASLSLRYQPELVFRLDDSLERGFRIDELLDLLHDETLDDEGGAE